MPADNITRAGTLAVANGKPPHSYQALASTLLEFADALRDVLPGPSQRFMARGTPACVRAAALLRDFNAEPAVKESLTTPEGVNG